MSTASNASNAAVMYLAVKLETFSLESLNEFERYTTTKTAAGSFSKEDRNNLIDKPVAATMKSTVGVFLKQKNATEQDILKLDHVEFFQAARQTLSNGATNTTTATANLRSYLNNNPCTWVDSFSSCIIQFLINFWTALYKYIETNGAGTDNAHMLYKIIRDKMAAFPANSPTQVLITRVRADIERDIELKKITEATLTLEHVQQVMTEKALEIAQAHNADKDVIWNTTQSSAANTNGGNANANANSRKRNHENTHDNRPNKKKSKWEKKHKHNGNSNGYGNNNNANKQSACSACGHSHGDKECWFVTAGHPDLNKDASKSFAASDKGIAWRNMLSKSPKYIDGKTRIALGFKKTLTGDFVSNVPLPKKSKE
jgi:hypothetical protein